MDFLGLSVLRKVFPGAGRPPGRARPLSLRLVFAWTCDIPAEQKTNLPRKTRHDGCNCVDAGVC